MYAYKKAMELGADMIDMDAYVTQDNQLVLTHDLEAYKNSEAPNDGRPRHQRPDARRAEGRSTSLTSGVRTTDPAGRPVRSGASPRAPSPPPTGFTAEDFQIPTFNEVLDEFPDTPINIELKQVAGVSIDDTVDRDGRRSSPPIRDTTRT